MPAQAAEQHVDESNPARQGNRCSVVRLGEPVHGKQGLASFPGVSAETVGARGICMHLVTIPPGGLAKAHIHEGHETAIYILSGESEMWYGQGLEERLVARAGEFIYIPAGMPHLPANLSQTEPCVAVLARTDPNEQESVVLLPGLAFIETPSAPDSAPAEYPGDKETGCHSGADEAGANYADYLMGPLGR